MKFNEPKNIQLEFSEEELETLTKAKNIIKEITAYADKNNKIKCNYSYDEKHGSYIYITELNALAWDIENLIHAKELGR